MSHPLNLLEARLAFSEGRLTPRDYLRTGLEAISRPRLAIVRLPFWSRGDAEQQGAFDVAVETLGRQAPASRR